MPSITTVSIREDTKSDLRDLKSEIGEAERYRTTYDDVLKELIQAYPTESASGAQDE